MKKNNFHYVAVLLDMLYGLQLEDEDLEELGLLAWNLIGNKDTRLYKYTTCISRDDNSVLLPCNVLNVESVTLPYEDWNRVTNKSVNGDYKSAIVENYIESEKIFDNPFYMSGKLIPFKLIEDILYFQHNYGKINILYKGTLVDEDGLPSLTDKEANAIATYIAYVNKYKEGLITNNTVTINLATNLENKWNKLCDLARVTYLNQNDMNEILNIKTSWDRKSYNYSYKPIH